MINTICVLPILHSLSYIFYTYTTYTRFLFFFFCEKNVIKTQFNLIIILFFVLAENLAIHFSAPQS